jgi:hypothetical protein
MSKLHWVGPIATALVAVQLLSIAAVGCDSVRDAEGLTVELERRYPGSRIEIREQHEDGAQTVEVKIVAPSFGDDMNLAEEARDVAESIQQRYGMHAESDTVSVEFQAERSMGGLATSSSASFVYPVSELGVSD